MTFLALVPQTTYNVLRYQADPTGATDSTTAFMDAWNALKTSGGGTLYVPFGNYLTKDLLFQSFSNFVLRGDRGSVIWNSSNTLSSPGQATHNVCIIADCTDFAVDGLTFDGRRDTIAGDQFLTQNANSGQNQVHIQDGTKYVVGMGISIFGGMTANGGNDATKADQFLKITAITGNVLTLNANLSNTYTGTGASGGAYATQYQTGGVVAYSIAGRSLGNEDAQNGLHLMNCQRFTVRNCVFQNVWESPVKCGTGFQTTSPTDGCSYGIFVGNMSKHGYDQGISIWNCQYITVTGNKCEDAGWAGISFSHSNDCTATGNVCTNNYYSPATDLNEGTGIAIEGGVHVVVEGNVCSSNTSNGIRLNGSPMFGGAALNQGVSGSPSVGNTSITLTGTNSAFVAGGSYTIVDSNNELIRETIYVTNVSGTTITISPALRNNYSSGPTIYGRYGEGCLLVGNDCSQNALSSGIHTYQQIGLRVVGNDCSKNGYANGVFSTSALIHGIHIFNYCDEAVIEANSCTYNSGDGISIDNYNRAVVIQGNSCLHNGLSGTNFSMGIKWYGPEDGALIGNTCNYNSNNGIYMQNGNLSTQRCVITGNTCLYNTSAGIWLDNGGTEFIIQGNRVGYNGDTGIKVLGYNNSIFHGNECYNQQGQEGIRFDDSGSSYCTDNRVYDNLLFSDNNSQSWGFRELNHSARTILRGNRTFGNTNAAQVSISSTSRIAPDVDYDINVKDPLYGAVGDGVTDDTAALQAALSAAAGNICYFPAGVYLVSASLLYPGNIKIFGAGDADGGTIIRVKTGTALTTPVLCSADWYNNTSTCGSPVEIADIEIDGNSATSGSGAHGFVGYNFWSSFDRMLINNVAGDGFLFTAHSRNGTHISNTCVEPKISRVQVRTCGGDGIHIKDNGSPLNSCTDGFLKDCIVTAAGGQGIHHEMGPGWIITGNHIYGTVSSAIQVSKCYATRVTNNYIDGFGSGSSAYIAGIEMDCLDGRGSSCIGNHVGFEGGTAAGPYYGFAINGAGSGTAMCVVTGNTVNGGSQSGSIGYAIQTNSSQIGHSWLVYFHDNDAQNVATYLYEDSHVTGGDMVVLGHLGSVSQNAPTAAAGANAGTSPPSPALTGCTDVSGQITFGTGTGPAAGAQVVITFNVAYANAPKVVLTPLNSASASLNLYVSSTTTTCTISCVNAPSASQGNTVYGFFYLVMI